MSFWDLVTVVLLFGGLFVVVWLRFDKSRLGALLLEKPPLVYAMLAFAILVLVVALEVSVGHENDDRIPEAYGFLADVVILGFGISLYQYWRDRVRQVRDLQSKLTDTRMLQDQASVFGKVSALIRLNRLHGEIPPLDGVALKSASLERIDLTECRLPYADLDEAQLRYAVLQRAFAHNAFVRRADLSFADMSSASFYASDFEESTLSASNMTAANFSAANLTRARLTSVLAEDARFVRAILVDAMLDSADLTGANLASANLTRANLENAELKNTSIDNALLTSANLAGATNLKWMKLRHAKDWHRVVALPTDTENEIKWLIQNGIISDEDAIHYDEYRRFRYAPE
ncbi:MAG: pentapeptide repeat-containing protein [candidate division Zixibacteria bacterium]|nr:pentapeptide repeat-containing protein [candidate division Zixibacteria bacterium]